MGTRSVFIPNLEGSPWVDSISIDVYQQIGRSIDQTNYAVLRTHDEARQQGISPVLEISGRSTLPLGRSLSAWNLQLRNPGDRKSTVECSYQGSKVFTGGGPYQDLYYESSGKAKTDKRLRESGKLIGFRYYDIEFELEPKTMFYDCLYLSALSQGQRDWELLKKLNVFKGFSDIYFNPEKGVSCQARSLALYIALYSSRAINDIAARTAEEYRDLLTTLM